MNRTGLIAKISIKYVLPTCIWKYFWQISQYFAVFWEFRGISRKYLNFAGPRPREISEALISRLSLIVWVNIVLDRTVVIDNDFRVKMTTAQVVEMSVTVNNNSPIQDYVPWTIKLNLLLK